ncbi:MAG TPA: periplasmic heavy metal sensor [Thermoanaerobaculia bacterium]|nr:periplasmic heavy metal sensor [Thermoanaerobaculia bacterium]
MTRIAFPSALLVLALAGATPLAAQEPPAHERHVGRPKAIVQERSVASLPAEETAGLLEGSGMGMALVAELNHYPGPRHVLDLGDALELSPEQRRATEQIFRRMSDRAMELGAKIVEGEKALDAAFASGEIERATLERSVAAIANLRGELRAVHLLAHLEMKAVLTPAQVAAYERLRSRAP